MKLTDAAIWDIEMGAPAAHVAATPGQGRTPYAAFEPSFAAMPWLHKAQLKVVDVQAAAAGQQPSWLVLADTEEAGVFLLLRATPESVEAFVAKPLPNGPSPGTAAEPSAWAVVAPVTGPLDLLRALNNPWGVGRHVGD